MEVENTQHPSPLLVLHQSSANTVNKVRAEEFISDEKVHFREVSFLPAEISSQKRERGQYQQLFHFLKEGKRKF